jgi:hypothetical protein
MLRRLTPLALLLALATAPAHAQQIDAVGFRAGANFSRITTPLSGYTDRVGLQVAGLGQFRLNPDLSLIGEIEYAQRGYGLTPALADEVSGAGSRAVSSTTLHYLALPVLVHFGAAQPIGPEPYGLFGGRVDFLVARSPGSVPDPEGGPDVEDEMALALRSFNVGVTAGGGITMPRPRGGEVRLEGRYTYGLLDQLPEAAGAVTVYFHGPELSLAITF